MEKLILFYKVRKTTYRLDNNSNHFLRKINCIFELSFQRFHAFFSLISLIESFYSLDTCFRSSIKICSHFFSEIHSSWFFPSLFSLKTTNKNILVKQNIIEFQTASPKPGKRYENLWYFGNIFWCFDLYFYN